ncbi:ubiquinone anaerobic biosynthesis protein UbiU [Hydrogenophilus islandicus]
MELVCPAGNPEMVRAAVEAGADAVYLGLRNATNARHFPGLNFTPHELTTTIAWAHQKGVRVFLAINTYPKEHNRDLWHRTIDQAAELGVDALILADLGLMAYAHERYPEVRLHASVQTSATSAPALQLLARRYGVVRAVLPRVLSIDQVAHVCKEAAPLEIEVFGFGGLCIMVEGRCSLSSYATGEAPNHHGACSPAHFVSWEERETGMEARLNGFLIDRYAPDEPAGYPTLCKGRFVVDGEIGYALESPTSLNTLDLLPELKRCGVRAIKIEGRQRSVAYIRTVTRVWRQAIDTLAKYPDDHFTVQTEWQEELARISEGGQTTLGPYSRPWK